MIRFECDYGEGAHPEIMAKLAETNLEQTPGYGEDVYCREAAGYIKTLCEAPGADVHFLTGGTQANATVIASALRPHQGVISASGGHINVHETGAVEAAGHKIIALSGEEGKITAGQIESACYAHYTEDGPEHTVQPAMVYISLPTECGTVYGAHEPFKISSVCRELGLYLFLDGARLGDGRVPARFCTSWAAPEDNVEALIRHIERL